MPELAAAFLQSVADSLGDLFKPKKAPLEPEILPPDLPATSVINVTAAFDAEWRKPFSKHGEGQREGTERATTEEEDASSFNDFNFWRVAPPPPTRKQLLEITPRNSRNPDDEETPPAEPILVSDLARGIEVEIELSERPLKLASPLAKRAAAAVQAEEEAELAGHSPPQQPRGVPPFAKAIPPTQPTLTAAEAKMLARQAKSSAARALVY